MAKAEIDLGQVIWTDVVDPQGKDVGEHAVIILTSKAEYAAGKPIKGVVVSSQLRLAAPDSRVMMRWTRDGHVHTRFDRRCAAMCKWTVLVEEGQIHRYGGRVQGNDLKKVIACIEANKPKATPS